MGFFMTVRLIAFACVIFAPTLAFAQPYLVFPREDANTFFVKGTFTEGAGITHDHLLFATWADPSIQMLIPNIDFAWHRAIPMPPAGGWAVANFGDGFAAIPQVLPNAAIPLSSTIIYDARLQSATAPPVALGFSESSAEIKMPAWLDFQWEYRPAMGSVEFVFGLRGQQHGAKREGASTRTMAIPFPSGFHAS